MTKNDAGGGRGCSFPAFYFQIPLDVYIKMGVLYIMKCIKLLGGEFSASDIADYAKRILGLDPVTFV